MQILLNKQCTLLWLFFVHGISLTFFLDKEDKKIETLKKLQQIEEQKERETEMKELALKLRKR